LKIPKLIAGSANLLLRRGYPTEPWQLAWPKKIQQASFASLTHDELMRLGLFEKLAGRIGTIRVRLTIKEIEDKEPEGATPPTEAELLDDSQHAMEGD
jgi:hypothetical protein